MPEQRLTPDFESSEPPSITETHISVVSFIGDRCYKLKKPVNLGFLDFTDRAERERSCHREVDLNRRLAPDVYLGVADIASSDGICDHVVVMRRMPGDRRLSTLVRDPERRALAEAAPERLARLLADFHSRADRSQEIAAAATSSAVRRNWEQSFAQLEPFIGHGLDETSCRRIETLVRRYLDGRDALFNSRIESDCVCDGHGDLQADDIFMLDDGPRILDCIEFSDSLRFGDVISDVAFLAMDFERLGAQDLAEKFISDYCNFAGETCATSLIHHYVAYRAHVRAKVNCLRAQQERASGAETLVPAARLIEVAREHLDRARVRLVLVGGLPGTGKSTLAERIASHFGWTVIRTDSVRSELTDNQVAGSEQPFDEGRYSPEVTDAVYNRVRHLTRIALSSGESVVVDASWSDPTRRAEFRHLADDCIADLDELKCQTTAEIADHRMRRRARDGFDPSEATPSVARQMAKRFESWPRAITIDTSSSPEDSLERAVSSLTA
jgi:aminoglycoside phosphotransferase family enzyme/predicted kinase